MDARDRPRPRATDSHPFARVRVLGGRIELTLRRFTDEHLAAVKSIRGRRWLPGRRVWVLPNTKESLDALRRTFGKHLVVHEAPTDRRRPEPAQEAASAEPRVPEGPDAAVAGLLDAMKLEITTRDYSPKTERAYLGWARRFFRFHALSARAADPLEASDARAFLEHLATEQRLSAKSRNQAASALTFLFREILGRDDMGDIPHAKGPRRLPTVLSHREVLRVLRELSGKHLLIVMLLYAAGLRLGECLGIRIKDVDFELRQILVRNGKGKKDRYVPLATRAAGMLKDQIQRVAELHQSDRQAGKGWAPLPRALHRKDPTAGYQLGWQFVFPASTVSKDPATGRRGRRPLNPSAVQRQVKRAVRRSGITKKASCHTFRHSFATEALRGGCDLRTLEDVMGHKDIRTTMIYLHAVEHSGLHVRSPLDRVDDPEEDDWDLALKPPKPKRRN